MLLWVLCESMNFHPDEQLFQVKSTLDWTIVFILIIQKILLVEYFIIFKLTVFINPKHKTCKLKTYWEIVPSIIFLGYICNTKNAVTKTFAVNANGAKNKNFPPEFIWIHYVSPPLLLMKKDKESDVKILQPASHSTPQITVYSRTVCSYHLLLTLLIQVKPTKTIAENWVCKQSWFIFILKPAHTWPRLG